MAASLRFFLFALLVVFVAAQSSSVNGTTTTTPTVISSTTSPSTSVTTSSAPPPSTTPSAIPSTTPSVTTPSVVPTTSAQPTSSVVPSSSSSVQPPATPSSTTRASSVATTSASSSPVARSTTPSASLPPSTSSAVIAISTSQTASASSVTIPSVISSTETSPAAAPATTSSPAPPPSTSSSPNPPPPPSSTATQRASAQTSSRTAESSAYVYSSVSSSVIQSTVVSTNAVIVTTQGQNGQLTQLTSYTTIATTVPATTVYATTIVTSVESPTGIAGLQAQAIGGSDGSGLSTGAKAGIGAGVGVLVLAAAIFGALFAMRRRRKNKDRIAESDRYPPSSTPSFFGVGGAAIGKRNSRYTDSELHGSSSPPMRESNPLDRYATPGVSSQRTTLPPNSRTSDISSMSGSEPTTYRPGPGMPVVAEYNRNNGPEELPDHGRYNASGPNDDYIAPAGYSEASGNPFHEKSGNDTPSLYSDDGEGVPQRYPSHRQASPAALELSGDNTIAGSMSTSSGGYRGIDPEQPYHTRSQLTKPSSQQRQFDPGHNF